MSQFFDPVDADGVFVNTRQRRGDARFRVTVPVSELPSRTKQADAKGADINVIVARYKKTGELPVARRAALFQDMQAVDLKEAMDLLTSAQQSFAQLPAKVRANFNNDPAQLLAALDDSKNPETHKFLYKAGILAQDYVHPDPATPVAGKGEKAPKAVKKGGKQPDLPLED